MANENTAPAEVTPVVETEVTPEETAQEGSEENLLASEEKPEEGSLEAKKEEKEQKAIAKTLRKLKIKYNSKEIEEELPFEIPDTKEAIEYMTKQLQMGKLGQTKSQENAQMQRQIESFFETLKTNPRKILSDPNIGVDLRKLAAEVIEEEIANSQKSPEQLEKEAIERELKELKDKYEQEKNQAREREFERLQNVALEQYQTQIDMALQGSSLPKSPYVVKKIADYLLLGVQQGMDVQVKDVLPLVEEEIQNDIKSMFDVMPEEVVQKFIGKEKLTSLRKKSVARAKEAPPQPLSKAIKDTGANSKLEKKEEKKQTFKDFFQF